MMASRWQPQEEERAEGGDLGLFLLSRSSCPGSEAAGVSGQEERERRKSATQDKILFGK